MSLFNSSEAAIVRTVHKWFKEDARRLRPWRDQVEEDYRLYSGDQWEDEDKAYLRENNRPMVTINRTAPTIDAVTGAERANRQAVRYLPRTISENADDGPVAEQYTEVARWLRDRCDAEDEESEAFEDVLKVGVGCTETWIDFEEDPQFGKVKIERVPPMELLWDAEAKKRNLSDARRVYRVKRMDKERIKELWPEKRLDLSDGFEFPKTVEHQTDPADDYSNEMGKRKSDDIPVVQVQWWERRPIWRVVNPDGQTEFMTAEEFAVARESVPDIERFSIRQNRREYFQAFIAGKTLLQKSSLHENPNGQVIPGFTLKFVTGKRDEVEEQWFGILRAMRDPQRWTNKFFSTMIDIFNSNAKGGILAETGAFVDQRKAEEDWAKTDKIIWVNDGALSGNKPMVQERSQNQFPVALANMLSIVTGFTPDVSGVNIEMLGTAARTQSGIVEQTRIQQSLVTLQIFFDSLRRYRKEQGRVLLHFINLYVPDRTMVRVVGEDTFFRFNRNEDSSFDIIVDQSPTTPNQKQEVWFGLQQILPALLKAGIPMPMALLDYLPVPSSVISKIKRELAERQPSQEEQALQQQAALAEVQKLMAEVDSEKARALKDQATAFSNFAARQNDQTQTELDRQAQALEFMKFIAEELSKPDEIDIERKKLERKNGSD